MYLISKQEQTEPKVSRPEQREPKGEGSCGQAVQKLLVLGP